MLSNSSDAVVSDSEAAREIETLETGAASREKEEGVIAELRALRNPQLGQMRRSFRQHPYSIVSHLFVRNGRRRGCV